MQDKPVFPEPVAPGAAVRLSLNAKQANTCGCGALAAPDAVGPLLRFAGYDADNGACMPGLSMHLQWVVALGRQRCMHGAHRQSEIATACALAALSSLSSCQRMGHACICTACSC